MPQIIKQDRRKPKKIKWEERKEQFQNDKIFLQVYKGQINVA